MSARDFSVGDYVKCKASHDRYGTDSRLDRWIPGSSIKERVERKEDGTDPDKSGTTDVAIRNIETVVISDHEIEVWYYSPYIGLEKTQIGKLYICERCLQYFLSDDQYLSHQCPHADSLPGIEIYRDSNYAVYEVDGAFYEPYCMRLSLLSKLFLKSKSLQTKTRIFVFYALYEDGKFVGYYSREKGKSAKNNLSCIMVLPPYQKRGYGKFLIDLSYEFCRKNQISGGPEKPLSDLGKISYLAYWKMMVVDFLVRNSGNETNLREMSRETGINAEDLSEALVSLNLVDYFREDKFIVHITSQFDVIEEYVAKKNKSLLVKPGKGIFRQI